ncbi:MAG: diacylglycerol kinase family lipid kinase [Bacteroidales bacterium]|jgi:YegS/Rv2252/BmrU family lipid kinase|nr:diacylglycerol kinase family lipid kinase [Bacteroidales bacterium]
MKTNKWLVVVNPAAGGRKAEKDWEQIEGLLFKHKILFEPVFTHRKLHAMVLTKRMIELGFNRIIVVGGDGTMNEVINGVFAQKSIPTNEVMLGMISVGTGNDWGKMFNIPSDYEEAIKTIKTQKTFIQDAGVVTYCKSNKTWQRYFINIAGMGFGAKVVSRSNNLKAKGKSSPSLYLVTLFTSLLSYKSIKAEIQIDGTSFKRKVFNLNIGIGKFNGGGMMPIPDAIADDGLYSITLIKKMGRIRVIANIKKLYNGQITRHRRVESYTGKTINVDSKSILHLETDGETLGHSPMEFQIIPRSVKVIANGISA